MLNFYKKSLEKDVEKFVEKINFGDIRGERAFIHILKI